MERYQFGEIAITLGSRGSSRYVKVSYPVKYGIHSVIESRSYAYYFNQSGEIRYIGLKGKNQPGDEWLKRSVTDSWSYYTPGIYTGIFSFLGEYYLPCFPYASNSIFAFRPFEREEVRHAIESLDLLPGLLPEPGSHGTERELGEFLQAVTGNTRRVLKEKSARLHEIIGGTVSVLPPDTRHVDYDVIPLIIADGCLYNCGFCLVKSGEEFRPREMSRIDSQIGMLRSFYGSDLVNYNSLFLGLHDALNSGEEVIDYSLGRAREAFGFERSYMKGCNLFIFGSVESLLNAGEGLLKKINRSGYYAYVNVGLESGDGDTLKQLRKPIAAGDVREAVKKISYVNGRYENLEISVNFLIGDEFSENHYESIIALCGSEEGGLNGRTTVYLSPTPGSRNITVLQNKFKELKTSLRLPVYLYLIQAL